jgi:hypothetical protein
LIQLGFYTFTSMKKLVSLAILLFAGSTIATAQKYKNGSVSMYNAKGQRYGDTYHKLQLGVLFPGSMPARKNVWYSKKLDPAVSGKAALPALNLQYAWSSNPNTEFLVHAGYEQVKYYQASLPSQSDHSRHFGYLLVGVNYKWWQQKNLTLYSGLLLGGGMGKYAVTGDDQVDWSFETDRTDWFYPSAQLTAIGANYGKRFGIFGEIAFGSKGVITGGVYLKM